MIIKAVLCYGASALIIAAAVFAVIYFFKLTKRRLSALHTFIGALSFVAVLIIMFPLMMYAFSENSTAYMTSIMPEGIYKISIAVLFFLLVGLLRFFAVNKIYFNRYKNDEGMSFMAGYGLAGGILIGLYCLFMFLYVVITSCLHNFSSLTEGQTLLFENGTGISVFTPFSSHIFAAVIFAVYTALIMITASFMDQHAKLPYRIHSTLLMYAITCTCEILMICIILFAWSKTNPAAISIVCTIIAALAALALRMLYKYKAELPYNKQFD